MAMAVLNENANRILVESVLKSFEMPFNRTLSGYQESVFDFVKVLLAKLEGSFVAGAYVSYLEGVLDTYPEVRLYFMNRRHDRSYIQNVMDDILGPGKFCFSNSEYPYRSGSILMRHDGGEIDEMGLTLSFNYCVGMQYDNFMQGLHKVVQNIRFSVERVALFDGKIFRFSKVGYFNTELDFNEFVYLLPWFKWLGKNRTFSSPFGLAYYAVNVQRTVNENRIVLPDN